MRKLSKKQREWNLAHSKKAVRTLQKRNRNQQQHDKPKGSTSNNENIIVLTAPRIFSLVSDQSETLLFFENAFSKIKDCQVRQKIFFNLYGVEVVTVDAVMYLIALIKNMKRINAFKVICQGNMPRNAEARMTLERVGFFEYVHSDVRKSVFSGDKRTRIIQGKDADGVVAGTLCEFVHEVSQKDRLSTKRLYPMVMELMTNTRQHAYRHEHGVMDDRWYIYAENAEEKIRFVFLDTGVGIPSTVRKGFAEIIQRFVKKDDAKLIASALKGDFRTETNEAHRGKGLPQIYGDSCQGLIENLTVISGSGKCFVNNLCEIEEVQLEASLWGALFCWDFIK